MELYLADKKSKANAIQINSLAEDDEALDMINEVEFETEEEFNAINAIRMRRGLAPRPRPQYFRRNGFSSQTQGFSGSGNGNGKKTEIC